MNQCKWLMIGSTTPCNKLTKKEYCGFHMTSVRRGSTGPKPCIACGVGVRSNTQLCIPHGGKKYRELKRYYDVYTHIDHQLPVISSPIDYVNRQFKNNHLDKEKVI